MAEYSKTCEYCSKDYTARMKNQRFCNPTCSKYKKNSLTERLCESCGIKFMSGRVDKRVCGKKKCLSFLSKSRRYSWRLKYFGLSVEDFERMVKEQNGLCSICHKPETYLHKGVLQNLSIDHCHETSKVRGLLCAHCNKALGLFKENIEAMKRAIKYIKLHKENVDE